MLSFELEFEPLRPRAPDDALWAAGTAMVRRMCVELRDYFGIEAVASPRNGWASGSAPLELSTTSTSAAGAIFSGAAKQVRIGARLQVLRRRPEATGAEIDQVADESVHRRWEPARNRIIEYIEGGDTVRLWTMTSMWYTPHNVPALSGNIQINPFYWFDATGARTMTWSSERARAAHSPTMYLLHELGHREGCLFNTTPMACVGDNDRNDNLNDVDEAVRHHIGIGQRNTYPLRHTAGSYLLVDAPVRDGAVSDSFPSGRQWVRYPDAECLATGRCTEVPGR